MALSLFKDVLAFVLFIPTALISGATLIHDASPRDWLMLVASGIMGIGLADTIFFYSLKRLGAGLAAIVNCLYSPAVIALSLIFLSEHLSWIQDCGCRGDCRWNRARNHPE